MKQILHDGRFVRDIQKLMRIIKPSPAKKLAHWTIEVDVREDGTRVIELWTDRGETTRDGTWLPYSSALVQITDENGRSLRWQSISAYQFGGSAADASLYWDALRHALMRFYKRHGIQAAKLGGRP
jgi:hypothetical protein